MLFHHLLDLLLEVIASAGGDVVALEEADQVEVYFWVDEIRGVEEARGMVFLYSLS